MVVWAFFELPFSCPLPSLLNVFHDGHLVEHAIRPLCSDWSVARTSLFGDELLLDHTNFASFCDWSVVGKVLPEGRGDGKSPHKHNSIYGV